MIEIRASYWIFYKIMVKFKSFCKNHKFVTPVLAALTIGLFVDVIVFIVSAATFTGESFLEMLVAWLFISMFVGIPAVLTLYEIWALIKPADTEHIQTVIYDISTFCVGFIYSWLYLGIVRNVTTADYTETLYNAQVHTPIANAHLLTVIVLMMLGILGWLVLNVIPLRRLPPLIVVTGIALMYMGCGIGVLFAVQVWDPVLAVLPFNLVLMTARTVRMLIYEWNSLNKESRVYKSAFMNHCCRILHNAALWPLLAFVMMRPLFGIVVAILTLFGQQPDAVIKAWTETSDWKISQYTSPQKIYYDEHYLCTVAAGGHEKVVKPKRLGVRHGHQVIVNRQLCVANAFEQILEERTPAFHRVVRKIYDKYGFPVARLIRSRYAADAVYILMKPLEWLFLFVIYSTDAAPEDRIAIQYTGKTKEEILRHQPF